MGHRKRVCDDCLKKRKEEKRNTWRREGQSKKAIAYREKAAQKRSEKYHNNEEFRKGRLEYAKKRFRLIQEGKWHYPRKKK